MSMYRSAVSQSIRIPARVVNTAPPRLFSGPAFRTVATAPPPPSGHPAPNPTAKKGAYNTFLYTFLGAAAAGSAYYYFTQHQENAKSDEERLKGQARDAIGIAKDKSAEMEKRAMGDYQQIKDKAVGLKSTMEKDLRASDIRGKSIGQDLESKYESAKGLARDNLNRARESTENLYEEARSSAEQKAHEAHELADKQAAEVKRGWFSWWGRK